MISSMLICLRLKIKICFQVNTSILRQSKEWPSRVTSCYFSPFTHLNAERQQVQFALVYDKGKTRVWVISCYHRLTAFLRIHPVAKRQKQGSRTKQQQGFFVKYKRDSSRVPWTKMSWCCFDWMFWFLTWWVIVWGVGVSVGGWDANKISNLCFQSFNITQFPQVWIFFYVFFVSAPSLSSALACLGLVFPPNSEAWQADARAGWCHTTPSHLSWGAAQWQWICAAYYS